MIGQVSRNYLAGRDDARAGRSPATSRQRGETHRMHGYYLEGWRNWRPGPGEGFPQLELPLTASQDDPGARLDTRRD